MFLGRGRILWFLDAPLAGVDRNQISAIYETYNYTPTKIPVTAIVVAGIFYVGI